MSENTLIMKKCFMFFNRFLIFTLVFLFVSCGPSMQKMESLDEQEVTEVVSLDRGNRSADNLANKVADNVVTVVQETVDDDTGIANTSSGSEIVQIETTVSSGTTDLTYEDVVKDSLVEFQVKSLDLLKASIDGCFEGESSTLLSENMYTNYDFPTPGEALQFKADGKSQFIGLTSSYLNFVDVKLIKDKDNDLSNMSVLDETQVDFKTPSGSNVKFIPNVIDVESANLNDVSQSVRTGVAIDSLGDRYLRSLALVAQVVAHNCNLSSRNCDCTTPEAATAMLKKCLPTLDMTLEKWAEAADTMALQCKSGMFQQRQAIASLVSSYAFAIRR